MARNSTGRGELMRATTLLFVPGDRPERFEKAVVSGAELVVLDLEDAVAPAARERARAQVASWLTAGGHAAVRINAIGDPDHEADVAALADLGVPVMVPKSDSAVALERLRERLRPDTELIALVETARGIQAAADVATVPGVTRLALGTFDLAAELGVSPDSREAMSYARSSLVYASAAAGLPGPIDGVTGAVKDDDRLRDDLAYAIGLGMGGKLCVHPRQVPVALAAFAPSAAEVAWAQRVVSADDGSGVVLLDGAMVDKPVLDRARRVLAAQRHTGG